MSVYQNSYRTFLGIENIHVMRETHQKLRKLCLEYRYREHRGSRLNFNEGSTPDGEERSGVYPSGEEGYYHNKEHKRRVEEVPVEDSHEFIMAVLGTGWLQNLSTILTGALVIVKLILGLPITEVEVGDGVEWLGNLRGGSERDFTRSPQGKPVAIVTHCSDGWDRTPQLTSLVQLLLGKLCLLFIFLK